jgi:hypothetical protein
MVQQLDAKYRQGTSRLVTASIYYSKQSVLAEFEIVEEGYFHKTHTIKSSVPAWFVGMCEAYNFDTTRRCRTTPASGGSHGARKWGITGIVRSKYHMRASTYPSSFFAVGDRSPARSFCG